MRVTKLCDRSRRRRLLSSMCVAGVLMVATTSGFALWQTSPVGPVAAPPVRLTPTRLSRLVLPVYGSEHLLLFSKQDEDDARVLPVLLRFREGEQLEKLSADESPPGAMAIGVECAARVKIFQAASRSALAPWDLMRLGDGCASFSEALLRFLSRNGWTPLAAELGASAVGVTRYREEAAVSNREMGMFTEAAPATVRVGELATALQCTGREGGEELTLELEGPGEAVLLACYGEVPLQAAAATWEQRAVLADSLPEVQDGRCTDLREALTIKRGDGES